MKESFAGGIQRIEQKDDRTLFIAWTDGRQQDIDVVALRRVCPCAGCKDEWTHKPLISPASIPETVRPIFIESVGRYALKVGFSDGHSTGIYSFDTLRGLSDTHDA